VRLDHLLSKEHHDRLCLSSPVCRANASAPSSSGMWNIDH
jgi:hypothetical protein